jgi:hypothetical protein
LSIVNANVGCLHGLKDILLNMNSPLPSSSPLPPPLLQNDGISCTTSTTDRSNDHLEQEDVAMQYTKDDDDNDSNNNNNAKVKDSSNNNNNNNNNDNNDESIPPIICSVLNTVVDYIMMAPTPLEPHDYDCQYNYKYKHTIATNQQQESPPPPQQQQPPRIQVPVLRIFGPVLRHDNSDNATTPVHHAFPDPLQSACLYIHGAFPYLLCRPVIAGADGSLHRHLQTSHEHSHVNWDKPDQVERILPLLHDALETTIQASMHDFGTTKGTSSNTGTHPAPPPPSTKTATSRTHTPVIRRLTVVLGRGFYTYSPGPPAPFVRVEYHHPQSRWQIKRILERGLALASQYHPDPVQYGVAATQSVSAQPDIIDDNSNNNNNDTTTTTPLPFHCYEAHIPYTMQVFKDYNLAGMSYIHLSRIRLRSPLPIHHRRYGYTLDTTTTTTVYDTTTLFLQHATPVQYTWDDGTAMPNETSKDENASNSGLFDTDITPLRHPPHKPFVPPVKTTTCDIELDVHVSEILNVHHVMKKLPGNERHAIHWRAVPSLRHMWEEERQRMARLLPPAHDFLSDTMSSPSSDDAKPPAFTLHEDAGVPGTKLAVEGMKRLVRVTQGLEEEFQRVTRDICQRHEKNIDHIDNALYQRRLSSKTARHLQLKEELDQTAQKQQHNDEASSIPSNDETFHALRALCSIEGETTNPSKPKPVRLQLTHSSHEVPSTQESKASSQKPLSPDDRFQAMSQSCYNIETPIATDDDYLEKSQRVDRGDCLVDGPFEHIEDFLDPETLRPFEYLDDDEDIDDDDDDEGSDAEAHLERTLSQLANDDTKVPTDNCSMLSSINGQVRDIESPALYLPHIEQVKDRVTGSSSEVSVEMSGALTENNMPSPVYSTPTYHDAIQSLQEASFPNWAHLPNVVDNASLLRVDRNMTSPMWMKFLAAYTQSRGIKASESNTSCDWFPLVGKGGIQCILSRNPPSRRNVESWFEKERKRRGNTNGVDSGSISKRLKMEAKQHSDLVERDQTDSVCNLLDSKVDEVEWKSNPIVPLSQFKAGNADSGSIVDAKSKGSPSAQISVGLHNLKSNDDAKISATESSQTSGLEEPASVQALSGMGNQGGRLWVAGGGKLKTGMNPSQGANSVGDSRTGTTYTYMPTPVLVMSVEIHVQCRTGRAGLNDSKTIAMTPDSDRDKVSAIMYIFGRDPGGGEAFQVIEHGCVLLPVERELENLVSTSNGSDALKSMADKLRTSLPKNILGVSSLPAISFVTSERQLLLQFCSLVCSMDPVRHMLSLHFIYL